MLGVIASCNQGPATTLSLKPYVAGSSLIALWFLPFLQAATLKMLGFTLLLSWQ